MSLMILITETSCSFLSLAKGNRSCYLWISETKMTPTRPTLEVSPVFWLCCWSLLYPCIYLLSSPHWLGCWIWFLSASDWNRSSRKLPTQSCGLWYWPHAAIKAASLGCGCHQRQMRRPVSGGWVWGGPWARLLRLVTFASAFDQLSPCSPPACPGLVSDCHQLLLPFRCCRFVSEFYTVWLYAVWILLFRLSRLDLDEWLVFWPDTWVEHLLLRITDLILPFLSTSHVHLLLCCVVKSILR